MTAQNWVLNVRITTLGSSPIAEMSKKTIDTRPVPRHLLEGTRPPGGLVNEARGAACSAMASSKDKAVSSGWKSVMKIFLVLLVSLRTARLLPSHLVFAIAFFGWVGVHSASANTLDPAMSNDCSSSSGQVQHLAKVVNTRDNKYHCLGVSVDAEANISGIRFETHDAMVNRANRTPDLREVPVRDFSLAEISSRHGAVLDGVPGHDAVVLQGDIPPAAGAASLAVRFLYNGITGESRECSVTLDRGRQQNWRLTNSRHQKVSLIVVKTWALPIIGTVGIETLQGICVN
jgi:hypothetical protein